MSTPVRDFTTPWAFTRVTGIDSVAAGITNPPPGVAKAVFQAEAQVVRYRDDGTAPTAAIGMYITPSTVEKVTYIGDLSKLKFIAAVAGGWVNLSIYV